MSKDFVAVNVPLAVLWCEPGAKRDHDRLILGADPDPAAWADGMDEEMRLWLVGKVDSQLLYGEVLTVLERAGDWLKVAACEQATGKDGRGYPGWLPAAQVCGCRRYLADRKNLPVAVVTAAKGRLYAAGAGKEAPPLSWQTRLPLLAAEGDRLRVRRPDGGVGFLSADEAAADVTGAFDGEAMAATARRFFGLRYLWGGTSAWGFDCSGLSFRLYQAQGIALPRDADEQAAAGQAVAEADLQPGDLLFFAGKGGVGDIHHVGVYSGGGLMVHAPNSRSAVREEPFRAGVYGEEFWGARRYR
jgi:cell wall-associated NlpC family hydrolase